MHVTGPRDLPDLRLTLLDLWRPGGPFEWTATAASGQWRRPSDEMEWIDPRFDRMALTEASLWWVTADMAQLVNHAAASLPPTTLTSELPPCPAGFAVFETPLAGSDALAEHAERPLRVDALLWAPVRLRASQPVTDQRPLHIGIGTYQRVRWNDGEMWAPLGRTDWAVGADTAEPIIDALNGDDLRLASMAEDRRWLAALWLLAGQERIAEAKPVSAGRPAQRRSQRAGVSGDVRLLDVRRRQHAETTTETSRLVDWSHRWIVEGHWRQQAYGPARSLRRPVWIVPFVKGPSDKPLVVRPTVRVLRD